MEGVVNHIVEKLNKVIIQPLIYLLIALSIVYFVWGLIIFLINSDNQGKRVEGQNHMMYGLLGLFIIMTVWGILNFIKGATEEILK